MIEVNFNESVNYLLSLGNEVSAMKLGLDNIRKLLAALGNPENNYLKVQVAGTNGKGSVCAFLDSICVTAGIRTGTFTSPHLVSITERVRVNGVDISEDDFAQHATFVRETAENLLEKGGLEYRPTFFEQVTAIALVAFADAKVELAILETGLGGRLDATTAANAEIAAITRIDLDHQEYLGNTVEEIAAEKAAIIQTFSRVVIGEQQPEAMKVLLDHCVNVGVVPLTSCEPHVWAFDTSKHSSVVEFRTNRHVYWDSSLGLAGKHQIENACIAVMIAERLREDFAFPLDEEVVWIGLENARHPGRLEYQGRYLFDGAHNVGGAKALRNFLDEFETRPITIIFGAMKDKDVGEIIEILQSKAEYLILTRPENERAFSAVELESYVTQTFERERVFSTPTVADALATADKITDDAGIILVTGSLYLIGEAKRILQYQI